MNEELKAYIDNVESRLNKRANMIQKNLVVRAKLTHSDVDAKPKATKRVITRTLSTQKECA